MFGDCGDTGRGVRAPGANELVDADVRVDDDDDATETSDDSALGSGCCHENAPRGDDDSEADDDEPRCENSDASVVDDELAVERQKFTLRMLGCDETRPQQQQQNQKST